MVNLHKINFDTNIYQNYLVYEDIDFVYKDTSVYQSPQLQDYLTIFILIDDFTETSHAQLINCIASIRLQTYLNINICIVNFDNSYYAQKNIKKIVKSMHLDMHQVLCGQEDDTLDFLVKCCNSKYVSFINFSDVIPRIKDIELVIEQLYKNNYDYLTLTVDYKYTNEFFVDVSSYNSILKSNDKLHYSAFYKTSELKKYKFSDLCKTNIDELMVVQFIKNNLRGDHLVSKTQMSFIGSISKEKQLKESQIA